MSRKKKDDSPVSFQITPMIDMTFLLLVFFMVTSKLSSEQKKMDIALSQSRVARFPDDLTNRDIINIDGEGRYFVGENMVTKDRLFSRSPLQ